MDRRVTQKMEDLWSLILADEELKVYVGNKLVEESLKRINKKRTKCNEKS